MLSLSFFPLVACSINSFDAVFYTRLGEFCLQILDVAIDEVERIHHVSHLAAEVFGNGRLRQYLVAIDDKEKQKIVLSACQVNNLICCVCGEDATSPTA